MVLGLTPGLYAYEAHAVPDEDHLWSLDLVSWFKTSAFKYLFPQALNQYLPCKLAEDNAFHDLKHCLALDV